MTRERTEFNCYCLDRLKPVTEEIRLSYEDDNGLHKKRFKVGLRALIKHVDCFVLYTESEEDLDDFVYIKTDDFYDRQEQFYTEVFKEREIREFFHKISTINIFQFASMMDFREIYEDFQDFIQINWEVLDMDSLIEL